MAVFGRFLRRGILRILPPPASGLLPLAVVASELTLGVTAYEGREFSPEVGS
jgi:hypothetical protein